MSPKPKNTRKAPQPAHIAITDFQAAGNFDGSIDGIMGLAYYALNDAYKFKTPTYPWPFASGSYNSELQQFMHIVKSEKIPLTEVPPYFNELESHHLTMNKFAFYTLRSWVNMATTNNSAIARDPLNNGIFVLGGGEQETDLYTGSFVHVDVLHDRLPPPTTASLRHCSICPNGPASTPSSPAPMANLRSSIDLQGISFEEYQSKIIEELYEYLDDPFIGWEAISDRFIGFFDIMGFKNIVKKSANEYEILRAKLLDIINSVYNTENIEFREKIYGEKNQV